MTVVTSTIEEPGTKNRVRVWELSNDSYNYDDIHQNRKKSRNRNAVSYSQPDPMIIFRNQNSSMVQIHSVYNLNPSLEIVRYWQRKYKHLPQIIFIEPKLKLNNYNILKMMLGFDIPICRNALVFKHAKAFHLRERIIEKLYGYKQMNENSNVIDFVSAWKNAEEAEFTRKMTKIAEFDEILPKARKTEYHLKRLSLLDDISRKSWYMKQQRKMILIKWPYDTIPLIEKNNEKSKKRSEKYLKRLPKKIVDFDCKMTLPMQVYPLKYLAYWELQKNAISLNHNCLCNFDYY